MGISLDEIVLDNSSAIKIQDTAGDELDVNADGSLNATVTATDLDIRDLSAATDNVAISDGTDTLAVNGDGSLNAVVSATDLDIRDLSAAQDNVAISDGVDTLAINADGSINTSFSVPTADDDADTGNPLKVGSRAFSGALTAVSASNDRADLLSDLYRRVWMNSSRNIALLNSQATVGTTAAQVLASPLAGRREVTIQNESNNDVYIGSSAGVTTANGIKISKNSSATFEWGEDIDIYMIASAAGSDVRFLEAG